MHESETANNNNNNNTFFCDPLKMPLGGGGDGGVSAIN